jgi:hypothetical protein
MAGLMLVMMMDGSSVNDSDGDSNDDEDYNEGIGRDGRLETVVSYLAR